MWSIIKLGYAKKTEIDYLLSHNVHVVLEIESSQLDRLGLYLMYVI